MDEVTNRKRGVIGLSFLQAKRSEVKRSEAKGKDGNQAHQKF